MLKHLSISNYVLIRELEMDFHSGLNIITGETGAGKSILLGALSLLTGKKAESSVFFNNEKNCVVEGEFDLDGENIILRRVITPSGRSRAFMNDEPVSVSVLADLSARLVDIHEQHQSGMLSDPDYQLQVLDRVAGNSQQIGEYRSLWDDLQNKRSEYNSLKASISAAALDRDYRQFQFEQLSAASLKTGELEELETEYKMLSNAENIRSELIAAEASIDIDGFSVPHNLKEAASALSRIDKFIPEMSELSKRLTEARIEVEDILADIESAVEKVNVSPVRLSEVEERMDVLYSLMKKHSVQSIEELIGLRDELDSSLSVEDNDRQSLSELKNTIEILSEATRKKAAELSASRKSAAGIFSQKLQNGIRELEMPQAEFFIELTQRDIPGPYGSDDIKFLFSANAGRQLGNLSKVASGGELSRVMLALKRLISEYTTLPTMIFDEIDTGVSGRMADRMGRMLSGMGDRMQIFAITHLPQIASQRGTHYLIRKKMVAEMTETQIVRLDQEERVSEIARMLSGDTLTDAAIENAKSLLDNNRTGK